MNYIGIDIGSTCAKFAVMDDDKNIVYKDSIPTGWSSPKAAEEIKSALSKNGFDAEKLRCIATGYGRISVPYADSVVTEITCHGLGAGFLFDRADMTVIDIGGQDTKIISLQNGKVSDFIMNDKCSAGTGRFLEVMSNALALSPDELCSMARDGSGVKISSMCTVFAESEIISLIGSGIERKDIAYAITESIAEKVASLAKKFAAASENVVLTGGLCEVDFLREMLGEKLGKPVISAPLARYAGAIGASLKAMEEK